MAVYMGEEEVIQKNMALAQEKVYTVEDIEALPEGVRAELIDGRCFIWRHRRGSIRGWSSRYPACYSLI